MIEKNEILTMASRLGLTPDTVEKDYVLGWLLWGINNDKILSSTWFFKGGTSLKKCFFETFRFSEDLDFTVSKQEQFTETYFKEAFARITENIHEKTGIDFFPNQFKFKIIPKERGRVSAQGKIHYNGPLRRTQNVATVKLDLTTDEIVVLASMNCRVHHPYTDEPSENIFANCYAFEEVVAEKIRALGERARPRDVYDVVHFFRNRNSIKHPQLVYSVLTKKCSYKGIPIPTFQAVEQHEKLDELKAQWENMLAHQLPNLPPLDSFWNDLEPFFTWLTGDLKEERLVSAAKADELVFQPGRIINAFSVDSIVHRIQFAAANRVCVRLKYSDKERTIEPLSFRTARDGNKLFYGFEREAQHPKAYSLLRIQDVQILNESYNEKYPVEISATGIVVMPPIRRPQRSHRTFGRQEYTLECTICGKRFRRSSYDTKLNPHKNRNGYACYGTIGIIHMN